MKRKIGWQKYENIIEDQLSSPILQELLTITNPPVEMLNTDEFTYEELESLQKELAYDTQAQQNHRCHLLRPVLQHSFPVAVGERQS